MSANHYYYCHFCEKSIEKFREEAYGKLPLKLYEKFVNAKKVDEIIEFLPDDFANGEYDRLEDLDYESVQDYGSGITIGEDGNMYISVSSQCLLCGKEFNYEIILPESSTVKKIDLTKEVKK